MLTDGRALDVAPDARDQSHGGTSPAVRAPSKFQQLMIPIAGLTNEPAEVPVSRRVTPGRTAQSVAAFHRAFNLPWKRQPGIDDVPADLLRLREQLLDEETTEFMLASHKRDIVGMADALADVVYVAYGTAITLGLDLDALLDEVHRSNMSKLDEHGRPVIRYDGKVQKSPLYRSPNIRRVIIEQPPLPF